MGLGKCRFASRRERRIYSPRAGLVDNHFFFERLSRFREVNY
jgi:hypothetical protein